VKEDKNCLHKVFVLSAKTKNHTCKTNPLGARRNRGGQLVQCSFSYQWEVFSVN